jgi:hypothetical protein
MDIRVQATHHSSPYARFNLFRNPFGELTREERAELAIVDTERWLAEFEVSGTVLQFIGPAGHGKTTHLLAIQRMLPDAPYIYLPEDEPLPSIPRHRPLVIDEVQRLPRRQRQQVFDAGGKLVLGTHDDLTAELETAQLRVVTVWVARDLLPEQLMHMLNARIEASRLTAAPVPCIERPHAAALLDQRGGSIRAIEQDLYDQFQHAAQRGLPWPPAI